MCTASNKDKLDGDVLPHHDFTCASDLSPLDNVSGRDCDQEFRRFALDYRLRQLGLVSSFDAFFNFIHEHLTFDQQRCSLPPLVVSSRQAKCIGLGTHHPHNGHSGSVECVLVQGAMCPSQYDSTLSNARLSRSRCRSGRLGLEVWPWLCWNSSAFIAWPPWPPWIDWSFCYLLYAIEVSQSRSRSMAEVQEKRNRASSG